MAKIHFFHLETGSQCLIAGRSTIFFVRSIDFYTFLAFPTGYNILKAPKTCTISLVKQHCPANTSKNYTTIRCPHAKRSAPLGTDLLYFKNSVSKYNYFIFSYLSFFCTFFFCWFFYYFSIKDILITSSIYYYRSSNKDRRVSTYQDTN